MSNPASGFAADSRHVAAVAPSPNHGARPDGVAPDMLVIHYTQMESAAAALARLCDPDSEVSAHYLIDGDGRVLQLVPEARRAWHAGISTWAGQSDLNSCSIGIEIAHPGHAGGLPPYPAAQIKATIGLAADIVARRRIVPGRVLGHSDIAPDRKEDPGEVFPWEALHAVGIGVWVPPVPIRPGPVLGPGAKSEDVRALQAALAGYGYGLAVTGVYDAETEKVVIAFQRHFRQARVDGVADVSTRETLRALAAVAVIPGPRSGARNP